MCDNMEVDPPELQLFGLKPIGVDMAIGIPKCGISQETLGIGLTIHTESHFYVICIDCHSRIGSTYSIHILLLYYDGKLHYSDDEWF